MAEARILYEIYDHDKISARDIVNNLRIDKSYVSRMLKKFEMRGIVERKESEEDARRAVLLLTESGKNITKKLIAESNLQVEKELTGIADCDLDKLSYHLAEIIRILGGKENGDY
ncbi:MAG: winged helix-turn-helix transcriptional regulator [Lachnospiraceae bacterium]|nr:winged helix-turn-helix transcriptional regulator [Lachnospiraceae bacterium]